MRDCVSIIGLVLCLLTASIPFALATDPLQWQTEAFFPLAPNGALTVENIDGSIHVYGWKEARVKVVALRKAYTTPRLHEIQVETNAQPTSIAVRTRIPPASGFFADRSETIDYTIVVPETARLEKLSLVNGEIVLQGLRGGNANAEIVNGKITALNCFAHLRGRAVNGAMELFYEWWEELPARFDYVIGYGTIRAKLTRQARFSADAQTAEGNITDQFNLPVERSGAAGKRLRAATATNPPISLLFRSGRGNISIDVTH